MVVDNYQVSANRVNDRCCLAIWGVTETTSEQRRVLQQVTR